jgi:glycosyltransferase involved in cell wall biosynthesis
VKIVHLVIGGEVAGGQMVALQLGEAARLRGDEVVFVSPTAGPFLDRVRASGLTAHVLPIGGALSPRAIVRLRGLLRAEHADVLHTHAHFSVNVVGRAAARLARVPIVAHMHIENAFRSGRIARALQRSIDNATARWCARILVVSEATRESLERQGYPRDELEVVYNGVDVTQAKPQRLVEGHTIVHVGRLAPVKGQRELIRALPQLEDAYAVFVGRDVEQGGSFARELEEEAASLGVHDRVLFAGRRDDVPALLAGADVLALPSRIEGLPLVVLEAMAQGTPVVATRVGGTPEIVVDGEAGMLVEPGDVDALAAALRTVLDDPKRAHRLGEAGRRRVLERFSLEAMTSRVLQMYDEVTRTMRP